MDTTLMKIWYNMPVWEQSLCVMFGVWLSLELMRDVWPGIKPYVIAWVSRLWTGGR